MLSLTAHHCVCSLTRGSTYVFSCSSPSVYGPPSSFFPPKPVFQVFGVGFWSRYSKYGGQARKRLIHRAAKNLLRKDLEKKNWSTCVLSSDEGEPESRVIQQTAADLMTRSRSDAKPRAVRYPSVLRKPPIQVTNVPHWAVPLVLFAAALSAGLALVLYRIGTLNTGKVLIAGVVLDTRGSSSTAVVVTEPLPDQLLGHFRSVEAPEATLKAVLADQSVKLRLAAADSFLQMQDAAYRDGVWLTPLSGFRSVKYQQALFFDIKASRLQGAADRAKVSAPPGYSEHHTGYAIDIGDAAAADTHLESGFETTAAFRWLQGSAARFHFEMSFPRDNIQGIMYEPWHWRYVGDDHSLHTFYAQRKLYGRLPST